ncbi:MAG: hypothetical protein KatS3mg111_3374 [Pirellulaceae bacterium]|nr:MAG: hypothetical protein KatS3mg111_3374 [Pirellulaceae bacterium]
MVIHSVPPMNRCALVARSRIGTSERCGTARDHEADGAPAGCPPPWEHLAWALIILCFASGCTSLWNRSPRLAADQGALSRRLELPVRWSGRRPPSHQGNWRPDLMVLPYAEITGNQIHLHNIRDCVYRTEEDYDVRHFDRRLQLCDVQSLDFVVVPFKEAGALAHTMLSFGLVDGEQIVFSAEARLKHGESYALVPSATGQYELMWVVGTERDLIQLRTDVRDVDVYLYPLRITPEQVQKVFLAAVERVNEIAARPEHYDLFTNNCTTNIVDLIDRLQPGLIQRDIRVLLPGNSDRLAYELGLIAMDGPFEQIRAACKINYLAHLHAGDPDFSQQIRPWRQLPAVPRDAPSRSASGMAPPSPSLQENSSGG